MILDKLNDDILIHIFNILSEKDKYLLLNVRMTCKDFYRLINFFDLKVFSLNNKFLELKNKYDAIENKTVKNYPVQFTKLVCVNVNCFPGRRWATVYRYSAGVLYFYYPSELNRCEYIDSYTYDTNRYYRVKQCENARYIKYL